MIKEEYTLLQLARGDVPDPYSAEIVDIDNYLLHGRQGKQAVPTRVRKGLETDVAAQQEKTPIQSLTEKKKEKFTQKSENSRRSPPRR